MPFISSPFEWKTSSTHYRAGAPRCPVANHGWADGAQLRSGPGAGRLLEQFGVEMVGASPEAIDMAEDRERFRNAMTESDWLHPAPSSPTAWKKVFKVKSTSVFLRSLRLSLPSAVAVVGSLIIERNSWKSWNGVWISLPAPGTAGESVLGWKEFEMEARRDRTG